MSRCSKKVVDQTNFLWIKSPPIASLTLTIHNQIIQDGPLHTSLNLIQLKPKTCCLTTRRHIPKGSHLHTQRHEKLRPCFLGKWPKPKTALPPRRRCFLPVQPPMLLGIARGTVVCNQYPDLQRGLCRGNSCEPACRYDLHTLLAVCQCFSNFFSRDPLRCRLRKAK